LMEFGQYTVHAKNRDFAHRTATELIASDALRMGAIRSLRARRGCCSSG
jgi:hypothetical protein